MTKSELKKKHAELIYNLTERLADYLLGERLPLDILEAQGGELLIPAGRKITKPMLKKVAMNWKYVELDPSPIRNRILQIIFKFENELEAVEKELSEKH